MKLDIVGGRKKKGDYCCMLCIRTWHLICVVKCYLLMFTSTEVACAFIFHVSGFLQAQFSQLRPVAMAPPVASRMPMYPPNAPGLGQQFLYGQGPPAMMPPQVTYLLLSLSCLLDYSQLFCFF